MKKTLLTIVFSVLYMTSASALGINVGVSGNAGLFAASAHEDLANDSSNRSTGSEHGSAAWGSIFGEVTLGDRFAVGIDYVPQALSSDTTETAKNDKDGSTTVNMRSNKIQVDFEELTSMYVIANITENFYVKAGGTRVEIITNENLGTGSTYGNTDMSGSIFGLGYNVTNDNGTFFRFEGNYMNFDGTSITSSANTNVIALNNLDGVSGKLSFGKSF